MSRTPTPSGLAGLYIGMAEVYSETAQIGKFALVSQLLADLADAKHPYVPEFYRLKGEMLLKHDPSNSAEAEECFRIAIEKSRPMAAKSWELRVTMSLARLLSKQNRREEARAARGNLCLVHRGLRTLDLIEAKALLDELSI